MAQNRWDPTACHEDLTLIEPERLVVQFTGEDRPGVPRYVFAERPIPKNGIFYYEVNIISQRTGTAIGLATKPNPMLPSGLPPATYSCWVGGNSGLFWGHMAEGEWACWQGGQRPSFGAGDVIGCGVNLATRRIIYTKNGERLDTTNSFVPDSADDLFPIVALSRRGDRIEANFGPNFRFDNVEAINNI
uniref:B30.2/SPRY domain-containing protein n=1 Tax=Globodera rostochiensis TaxID=31243 RepID=A0A914HG07_GLORO